MYSKTYSFTDLAVTFRHPSVGQLQLQGEGLGGVTFTMSGDISAHDTAADGSVMVSKIKIQNGTVTFSIQQVSEANDWLRRYYNYVTAAPANEFALASIIASSPAMGVSYTATGVSPQKRPDGSYEASGKQVSWVFMAAKIEEV